MWHKVRVQLDSFACVYLVFPALVFEETALSSLNGLGTIFEDDLTMYVRVYFWDLYSIPLIFMSVLVEISYCFDCCKFVISFGIRNYGASNFLPLFQCCFDWMGSVQISYEFKDDFFYFCQKHCWNFVGMTLYLQVVVDFTDILNVLSFSSG